MKHVSIVRQDAREQSVIKFCHQMSHSRAATSIEAKSNSTSYERFKTMFVWYCREALPRRLSIQYICDYHRLEDDLQRVFTLTIAQKNFHRAQRLSTLANDTWYMLSDRQTVGNGDTEHVDRCYSRDTWQHWWITISSVASSPSEYDFQRLSSVQREIVTVCPLFDMIKIIK